MSNLWYFCALFLQQLATVNSKINIEANECRLNAAERTYSRERERYCWIHSERRIPYTILYSANSIAICYVRYVSDVRVCESVNGKIQKFTHTEWKSKWFIEHSNTSFTSLWNWQILITKVQYPLIFAIFIIILLKIESDAPMIRMHFYWLSKMNSVKNWNYCITFM